MIFLFSNSSMIRECAKAGWLSLLLEGWREYQLRIAWAKGRSFSQPNKSPLSKKPESFRRFCGTWDFQSRRFGLIRTRTLRTITSRWMLFV